MRAMSPKTPVILMTAFGTPDVIEDAVRMGAFVLDKPFELADLVPLVEHTLAARLD